MSPIEDQMIPKGEQSLARVTQQETRANECIRKHVGLAMAGGAIPIPLVDLTAVTAVQLDMLKQLATIYAVEFDSRSTRAFVTSLLAALAGSAVARIGASLLKLVPGVGTLVGGAAQIGFTGASTYAVGNVFKRLFKEGRTTDTLTAAELKDELAAYFEAGKKLAEIVKEESGKMTRRVKQKLPGQRD